MKYFVAHLLSGDVERYYEALSREISRRFQTLPLHERVPAHITLKPPFETDEDGVQSVERALRSFARTIDPIPLTINGFGKFGFRTIYLNVNNEEAIECVRKSVSFMNTHFPWMPHPIHEGNKPHISVARFLDRTESRHIWRQLKDSRVRFSTYIDNVAILRKEERKWRLHTLIPLGTHAEGFSYIEKLTHTRSPLLY